MKKLLLLLALVFGLALTVGCSSEETSEETIPPDQLKPPLGLVAYPGDRSVLLEFDTANTGDDDPEFWGFAAHMAVGSFEGVPGDYYENANINEFDVYGNGNVDGNADPKDGLQPVAYTESAEGEGGIEASLTVLDGGEIPGRVSWTIASGDPIPVLDTDGDDDDDDTTDEDDDDDNDDADDDDDDDNDDNDDNDDDDVTRLATAQDGSCTFGSDPASLCLVNGETYTVFVVTRADEGEAVSWTSNWVTFTPRPEAANITLAPGCPGCTDPVKSVALDGVDLDQVAGGTVTPVNFLGDSNYASLGDPDSDGVDLMLESLTGQYNIPDITPYFSSCNSGILQDLGYKADWKEALEAPANDESYITPGQSVLVSLNHAYALKTGDGNYVKVYVTDIAADQSVTFKAAFQTDAGNRMFKE